MPRRKPEVVWMTAQLARAKGQLHRTTRRIRHKQLELESRQRQVLLLQAELSRLEKVRQTAWDDFLAFSQGMKDVVEKDPVVVAAQLRFGRRSKRGTLSRVLRLLIDAAGATGIRTKELADKTAAEFGVDVCEMDYWRRQVGKRLCQMRDRGVIEVVGRPGAGRGKDNRWRLPKNGVANLAALRASAENAGLLVQGPTQ